MSAIAVECPLTWTNRMHIGVAHHVTALIFYNITRCYDKHVAVIAVAVAAGDIIKYLSFVFGSFVWEIHVRYNKKVYLKKIVLRCLEYWIHFILSVTCYYICFIQLCFTCQALQFCAIIFFPFSMCWTLVKFILMFSMWLCVLLIVQYWLSYICNGHWWLNV